MLAPRLIDWVHATHSMQSSGHASSPFDLPKGHGAQLPLFQVMTLNDVQADSVQAVVHWPTTEADLRHACR